MDISPLTKAGIIDINIQEETCVHDILSELIQRFGQQESESELRFFLVEMLKRLTAEHKVVFYEYYYLDDIEQDIAPDTAYQLFDRNTFWQQSMPKLYVRFNTELQVESFAC